MSEVPEGKWSGRKCMPVPAIGEVVNVTMNGLGLETVLNFKPVEGYLGVIVRFHNPPDYYTRQNNGANPPGLVFGAEIRPVPKGKQSYNFKRFVRLYCIELHGEYDSQPAWLAGLRTNPPGYPRTLPRLAVRMTRGLITGRGNKDTGPIKRTCKALGIKHTYKAIIAFVTAAI